jgi:hypothetical protein
MGKFGFSLGFLSLFIASSSLNLVIPTFDSEHWDITNGECAKEVAKRGG